MDDGLNRVNPQWLERINEQVPQFAEAFTLPIFCVNSNREALPHGTGTLFAIGGDSFLVSAAHVLKQADKAQADLCVPAFDGGPDRFLPLNGDAYYTSDDQDGQFEDPFDLVVWILDPDIAQQLSAKRFVRQLDVAADETRAGDFYFVFGYPAAWTEFLGAEPRSIESTAIAFVTDSATEPVARLANYDPSIHILLNGNIRGFRAADGKPLREIERLNGISGCSIWKLFIDRDNAATWTPEQAKIVAVETAVYSTSKLIRGSRWGLVVKLIHKELPQLRPSLKLHLPREVP